ncbi:uncharacterized protein LOC143293738 isoform X2 [Babylonia areolata]
MTRPPPDPPTGDCTVEQGHCDDTGQGPCCGATSLTGAPVGSPHLSCPRFNGINVQVMLNTAFGAVMDILEFSSASNTVQPHLMMRKPMVMDVNPLNITWLCSFLTYRPQHVRVNHFSKDPHQHQNAMHRDMFSPPPPPKLFMLYTSRLPLLHQWNPPGEVLH